MPNEILSVVLSNGSNITFIRLLQHAGGFVENEHFRKHESSRREIE